MIMWLACALLILLALLFLLKPLVAKRGEDETPSGADADVEPLADRLAELERERAAGLVVDAEYAQARRETEAAYESCTRTNGALATLGAHAAARAPVAGAIVVLVTTVAAAVSYFYLSEGYRLLLAQRQASEMVEDFAEARAALERRLEEHPDDTEARLLFATSKYLAGEYAAAATEYHRVDEAGAITETGAWTQYADALLRSGGAARGERVLAALDKVPASDSRYDRALLFAGLLRFERREYEPAIVNWRRLLALLPEDASDSRKELERLIAQAQGETGEAATSDGTDKADKAITVSVSLADALRESAAPDDTVFVYARALDGPPIPLSIKRLSVADLPLEVRLDESGAMAEGLSLAEFEQVEIVARVSKQGKAAPAAGDLVGIVSPVNVGAAVAVEISDVIK